MSEFGPDTPQSGDMQTDTDRIQRSIEHWKNVNSANRREDPDCPLKSTRYYPDDQSWAKNWGLNGGPFQAGLNSTRHFVGGYGVTITPQPNNLLKVEVVNVTSMRSLVYDAPLVPNNPFGEGPNSFFRSQTNRYYWYVTAPDLNP